MDYKIDIFDPFQSLSSCASAIHQNFVYFASLERLGDVVSISATVLVTVALAISETVSTEETVQVSVFVVPA